MKRHPFVYTTLAAMSLIGCDRGNPSAELAGVTDQNATLIVFDSDDEGNRVPPELTTDQRDFLNSVVQAVKAKDIETLQQFDHRAPDDRSSHDSTRRFWESILEKDLHRYRFMRFTPDHPNNRNKLELHDGRRIRYSLDPKWILTLYHTPEDAYMVYSSDFIVGDDDGKLKFPANYADPPANP